MNVQFIEAFAGESQDLKISNDQLSGYTQRITAYQLLNVIYDNIGVCVIDTPGFSDAKISEYEIIEMSWFTRSNQIVR